MNITRIAGVVGGFALGTAALVGCSTENGTPQAETSAVSVAQSSASSTSSDTTTTEQSMPSSATPSLSAPANARTMTCSEFLTLDEATQTAVAGDIIADNRTKINPNNTGIAATLAKSLCTYKPESTVNDVLGAPPA